MAKELPLELLMLLCDRGVGMGKKIIEGTLSGAAFRDLASHNQPRRSRSRLEPPATRF